MAVWEAVLDAQQEQLRLEWARYIAELSRKLALDHSRPPSIDATQWFIGPKGENGKVLSELAEYAIKSHLDARRLYKPDDPRFNSARVSGSERLAEPQDLDDRLRGELDRVLKQLQGSVPLASYRNQSHMYWDITLPSVVGYFAAMLYNQNNVAAEASPVTTTLELLVGRDLCAMLGYRRPSEEDIARGAICPWGHITCDGSVANGESMWAARNLKFLPLALAAAIRIDESMQAASAVTVKTCQGKRARLIDLSNWELLNVQIDEAVDLIDRISRTTSVDAAAVRRAVDRYSIQNLGMMAFQSQYFDNPAHANAVVCAPATAHYSWPKNAALIGLGTHAVRSIPVDFDARMSLVHLRRQLDECLRNQWPVLQVVAVVGTTEEGAVDPLADIVKLRDEYRELGLEFAIHVDGAWGGYFASMLRECDVDVYDPARQIDEHPELQISDYVHRQLAAFEFTDTITIDPHKSGFIPYPAGGLCYRNGAMRQLIAYTAPVVYHDGRDETVGTYGIEGSKPGAAPASVYLSHAVIPLNRNGYGRLLGRCVFNNKRFYAALLAMADEQDLFTVTALQRLPSEKAQGTEREIREEIAFMRRQIVARDDNDELFSFLAKANQDASGATAAVHDDAKRALKLFQEIGSDLSIVAYAFNFRTAHGLNRDLDLMNEMNDWLFREMSLSPKSLEAGGIPTIDMIVTASSFQDRPYGREFVQKFAHRAGVRHRPDTPIKFLISTTQNPWLTATRDGNFVGALMDILRTKATAAAKHVMQRHGIAANDQHSTRVAENNNA